MIERPVCGGVFATTRYQAATASGLAAPPPLRAAKCATPRHPTPGTPLENAAKRALEVAAAGNHNVLMVGPPGAGKTMLARRMPALLPEPTPEEALEIATIASVGGIGRMQGVVRQGLRPTMESGIAVIVRTRERVSMPARPLVVAAMNPCPCGFGSW